MLRVSYTPIKHFGDGQITNICLSLKAKSEKIKLQARYCAYNIWCDNFYSPSKKSSSSCFIS